MSLDRIRGYLESRAMACQYRQEDGCDSLEFLHRGLRYYIWEYPPQEPGAVSNVRTAGRGEDFGPDYEAQILSILQSWE